MSLPVALAGVRLGPVGFAVWSLFREGNKVGWAHWHDNPDDLYRRRNRLTYSRDFSNAAWVKSGSAGIVCTITADAAVAPDGTLTADRITFDTGELSRCQQVLASILPLGTPSAYSVYLRSDTGNQTIRFGDANNLQDVALTSEWQRFFVYVASPATSPNVTLRNNSTGGARSVLAWGAQLETYTTTPTEYQDVPTTWEQVYLDAVGADRIFAWQDSAGTTPVTAVGQSVGLILDRAYGGLRGASLSAPTASLAGGATNNGDGTFTIPASGSIRFYYTLAQLSNGMLYEFEIERVGVASTGTITVDWCDGTQSILTAASAGTKAYHRGARATYDATYRFLDMVASGSSSITFRINFARSVPGTHRIQASAPSRPLLMARVNMLLASEDFNSASWTKSRATVTANAATAPNGTLTADKIVEDTNTGTHRAYQATTKPSAVASSWVFSVSLKAAERGFATVKMSDNTEADQGAFGINLSTGAVSAFVGTFTNMSVTVVDEGNGWWRVKFKATCDTDSQVVAWVQVANALGTSISYTGDGTSGIYAWGADLRTADDAAKNIPSYQRVGATAADHDTAGFPHYLLYDGTDDSYASTATVAGSGSDKVTMVTGVTKNSDAAVAVVVEHGDTVGSFDSLLMAPRSAGNSGIGGDLRGGGLISTNVVTSSSSLLAASSGVFSAVCDKSAATIADQLRYFKYGVGALTAGPSGTGPVTGNFFNAPVYYGGRGPALGGGLRFNGREYASIARFGPMSETERNRLEQWTKNLMRMP